MGLRKLQKPTRAAKCLVLVCINLSNLVCHSVYSVLASFFPQEARAKGLSDEPIGLVFAIFAAVIFLSAWRISTMLNVHGKRLIYVVGLATVAVGTMLFALADRITNLPLYFTWCFVLRCVQGFGSALEETAGYALIAEIDPEAVSFNLGVTEISTGLGYMVGPTIGGLLFQAGGFALPFICIGVALLPAMLLIVYIVPDDRASSRHSAATRAEEATATPMSQLLARPQILAIAFTAILGNTDYAFLEPTLAGHVESIARTSTAVGMLFSVTSLTYTLASPLMGWLSHKQRLGPRNVIIAGMAFQCLGFLLIGPSPLLPFSRGEQPLSLPLLCGALFLFGLGEAMSMTPLMEDMMLSCLDRKHDAINTLSALMTSCFSLGQMVGPLVGSFMAARFGFNWASTVIGVVLGMHCCMLIYLKRNSRPHQTADFDFWSAVSAGGSHSAVSPSTAGSSERTELVALSALEQQHFPRELAAAGDDELEADDDSTSLQRKWSS